MGRVYYKIEAQRILDQFLEDKLSELLKLAWLCKEDPKKVTEHAPIVLPDGWHYQVYSNCIIARYQDGEQEREAFFVPQIWIEFQSADVIKADKSTLERFPLGYCSCGKLIPFAKEILWTTDLASKKGFLRLPHRIFGNVFGLILFLWIWARPVHRYSLMFNRHPDCL